MGARGARARVDQASAARLLVAVLLLAGAGCATGPIPTAPSERYLRLEWRLEQTRAGTPIIAGQVVNLYGEPITNVRLAIEEMDAQGQVVHTTIGYVDGIIPGLGQSYFEIRVPRAGVPYRVRVLFFDLVIDPGQM
jgi:hypothetical protein